VDERAAAVCDALDTTENLFLGNQLILAALQVKRQKPWVRRHLLS